MIELAARVRQDVEHERFDIEIDGLVIDKEFSKER